MGHCLVEFPLKWTNTATCMPINRRHKDMVPICSVSQSPSNVWIYRYASPRLAQQRSYPFLIYKMLCLLAHGQDLLSHCLEFVLLLALLVFSKQLVCRSLINIYWMPFCAFSHKPHKMNLRKWWNESSKEPDWIFNIRIVTKWAFVFDGTSSLTTLILSAKGRYMRNCLYLTQ
jgi:hypothetical protein